MAKKHNLKQLEDFARDWGIYKWMHADNPDNEPVRSNKHRKPYNKNFNKNKKGFKGRK